MKLLTSTQVAAELGVNDSRIRQLARQKQIGQKLGRDWVFTPEEVEKLRTRKTTPGRNMSCPK